MNKYGNLTLEIIEKFKEGYPNSSLYFGRNKNENETYNYIVAGFAPGGVVVVWLSGSGKQIEIGRHHFKSRYQE